MVRPASVKNHQKKKQQKYLERDHEDRQLYLRRLQKEFKVKGFENIAYVDESGFDNRSKSSHGWAKRGQQLYGEVPGKREVRENLIACRYGQELIAPMIVKGSINAQCFEEWMKQHLFKELPKGCTIIMDNAPIHRKSVIMDLATASGHTVIFLPKYSCSK